jgi:hypothetical protein
MMPLDFVKATCSEHHTEMRHTAQMSYTAHTTKPILKTTQEKKRSCMY